MAKKLVKKEEQLAKSEYEPDRPGIKENFSRYSNINMRMKTARG